jgi:hypothetical protein
VAVIKKYRYRPPEPSGGEYQVNRTISIDITRLDAKTAGWREKLNRFLPNC